MPDKGMPPLPEKDSAHLYMGAGLKLKGEIANCDLMRIEGAYEGTAQVRQLILCPNGSFIGTAQAEEAEVEGTFEGTLNVRGRLFVRSKGLISGKFSYGELEIERGGQIDGQITPFDKKPADNMGLKAAAAAIRPPDTSAQPVGGPKLAPALPLRPAATASALGAGQPLTP